MASVIARFKPYLANSTWLIGERVASLGIAFLVSIAVARYLGPSDFGFLSYAISTGSLVAVAGHMGLNGLVVHDLVKQPEQSRAILGTVFGLKSLAYVLGFLGMVVLALATEERGSSRFWILIVAGASILTRPWEVLSFWFQAKVQSKYTAIPSVLSQASAAAIRLLMIALGVGVVGLAGAAVLQAVIFAVLISYYYLVKSGAKIGEWSFDKTIARQLLVRGGLVFAGAAFGIINVRIDQVMLEWLSGSTEVGQYSVAATLSEAWYFVPTAIVISVFPRLINLRQQDEGRYKQRIQQLFDMLFLIALAVSLIVALVAEPFISMVYGDAYRNSAAILKIHIFAGVFMFMRAAFSRWIIIENLLVLSMITQGVGAFMNVLLNLVMIPKWGGAGAAMATLFSYATSSYLSLIIHPRSRPIFWIMTKSILAPLRYPYHYIKTLAA